MTKFIKLCVLLVAITGLASCTDDNKNNAENDSGVSQTSTREINITSNNAGQFFNMNVQPARKSYENGYVMHYKITINLIGNYIIRSDVDFTIKTTAEYWASKTSSTMKLSMKKGDNTVSKEGTISFANHLDEINSITWTCICTEASGTLITK